MLKYVTSKCHKTFEESLQHERQSSDEFPQEIETLKGAEHTLRNILRESTGDYYKYKGRRACYENRTENKENFGNNERAQKNTSIGH